MRAVTLPIPPFLSSLFFLPFSPSPPPFPPFPTLVKNCLILVTGNLLITRVLLTLVIFRSGPRGVCLRASCIFPARPPGGELPQRAQSTTASSGVTGGAENITAHVRRSWSSGAPEWPHHPAAHPTHPEGSRVCNYFAPEESPSPAKTTAAGSPLDAQVAHHSRSLIISMALRHHRRITAGNHKRSKCPCFFPGGKGPSSATRPRDYSSTGLPSGIIGHALLQLLGNTRRQITLGNRPSMCT